MTTIDWQGIYAAGLPYGEFLAKYGTEPQQQRWQAKRDSLRLSDEQRERLGRFSRQMHVICMAGAWCGDCVDQCPMFALFEEGCPSLNIHFVDRDDCDAAFKESIKICGGNRVPVVVFLSEDFQPTGLYGDRTLSKYRQMVENLTGAACSTGITLPTQGEMDPLTTSVMEEWLGEFERNQWILRTSTRLREKHAD